MMGLGLEVVDLMLCQLSVGDTCPQRLDEGQVTESDTDPLTLLEQLKTKTIPCRSKRRFKHYIGLVIIIIVVQSFMCLTVHASIK